MHSRCRVLLLTASKWASCILFSRSTRRSFPALSDQHDCLTVSQTTFKLCLLLLSPKPRFAIEEGLTDADRCTTAPALDVDAASRTGNLKLTKVLGFAVVLDCGCDAIELPGLVGMGSVVVTLGDGGGGTGADTLGTVVGATRTGFLFCDCFTSLRLRLLLVFFLGFAVSE